MPPPPPPLAVSQNRVLVQRLADTQTELLRSQARADNAKADARAAAEAKEEAAAALATLHDAEHRLEAAQATALGAAKMHEALRGWFARLAKRRLRKWARATFKESPWREVQALAERDRKGREAELAALAQEAEESRSSVIEWAEKEVARRSAELNRRTELAEETAARARKRTSGLEVDRDKFRAEVGHERRKMAALRDRCFRLEADNENLTRALHLSSLR